MELEPAPASHVLHDDHSMALLHSMHLAGYEILEASAIPQHLMHPDDVVVVQVASSQFTFKGVPPSSCQDKISFE